MPVVTTAENPLMPLLVQRCADGHRPYPAIAGHLSEYGQNPPGTDAQAGLVPAPPSVRSYASVPTPLGPLLVAFTGDALVGLYFDGHVRTPHLSGRRGGPAASMRAVGDQLDEYFHGARTRFDLPLQLEGTPFQVTVWTALLDVPFGQTSTYAQLAAAIGRPRAYRAVGAANGQNPISIVVPCHRLIGTAGDLRGYGWGLDRKQALLELEGALAAHSAGSPSARLSGSGG
jgi:methylated-DNA-[protein]-cysteine S-methyltransferase